MKKSIKLLGNIASIIAVLFLIYRFINIDIDYKQLWNFRAIAFIVFGTSLWTAVIIFGCYPWNQYISLFCNKTIPFRKIQIVYLKSNILKYIPGNIFQYVGRNELAFIEECKHADVAMATIAEQATSVFVLGLYSFVLINKQSIIFLPEIKTHYILIFLFVLAILIYIIWRNGEIINYLKNTIKKISSFNGVKTVLKAIFIYALIQLTGPILYYIVLRWMFSMNLSVTDLLSLIGIYLFSALVGFLTPGAPGGIGIKEFVMISLSNGLIQESTIFVIALYFRIITIMADFLAYLYALMIEVGCQSP